MVSLVELNVSFKKPQCNLYEVNTIGAWQMCPLYGDVCFIESPSKNQNSSKVNMKSTICHDFTGPDLLCKVFFTLKIRFSTLVQNFHLEHQKASALKNIFDTTHIGGLVRAGESDRTTFIERTEYFNLSWWFV